MLAKTYLMALGIILFVIGVVGAFTGGHDHLMGGFGINATHNTVHIVSGLLAIGLAWAGELMARRGCQIFAVIYGLTWLGGALGVDAVVTGLNINAADNWLHFAIFASAAYFGFRPRRLDRMPDLDDLSARREREPVEAGRRY
jgi:hypothetical protein